MRNSLLINDNRHHIVLSYRCHVWVLYMYVQLQLVLLLSDLSRGILGTASLITATITSPIWAYQWLPAPKIRIHINSIAPLRCYPLHSKGSEWDGSWKSGFWLDSDLGHEWLIFAGREWPWKGVLMSICSIEKIGRWKTDPLWFE